MLGVQGIVKTQPVHLSVSDGVDNQLADAPEVSVKFWPNRDRLKVHRFLKLVN